MKLIRIIITGCCLLLLTACSFKPLSKKDFPPTMRTLNYAPKNPNGALATEIKRRLKSAGIQFSDKSKTKLVIKKVKFTTSQPIIFYSGNAVNFNYVLSVTYSIYENKKQIIGPITKSISRAILHNANQAYTSGEDVMVLRQLTQVLATEVVFDLTSHGTFRAIENFDRDLNAKHRHTVL